MDRLASCYFCGDAVDAQLQEYPLVTSDRIETGRTVVLCPSCRQKLTTVVEDVLDAAIDSGSTTDGPSVDLGDDPLETLEQPTDESHMTTTAVEPTDDVTETGDAATSDSADEQAGNSRESADFERGEYNKVVKLLQNREFPVEIEEITVVARSAYEIDRNTTHTILDVLIDRGVLEDRGDELVRA